ncbi:MAG: hypothetical protein J7L47_02500 [Candidatus Odinarchaeota archaeon]|nr:hypothetical protein [Candidatus Odinarchaeota archaeon]
MIMNLILTQVAFENIIIDVYIVYITLILFLLVWIAMKSIHSKVMTTTGIIWSEIYT